MEQLHRENGVPVRVEKATPKEFITHLSYYASLSGIEESSAFAGIDERVEQIHINIGDYVEKGKTIITFPVDNPEAKYNQAKVAYDNARISYKRISKIRRTGGISEQDFDNIKAQYDVAKANWQAAAKLIKVTAPISGHITRINVTESQNVQAGTELFTVSKTDKIKAGIWISDKNIHNVKTGAPAIAKWNGLELKGNVTRVDRAINSQHQAFGAQVELENPENLVNSGVTAEILVQTYEQPKALVIEKQHLLKDNQKQYIYLASSGMAIRREVKTGKEQGLLVEVLDGLNPNEWIIIAGHRMVNDGVKVNVIQ